MVSARELWAVFEPIHAVTYFAPECRAEFEQAGLRGFWRGYFAGRAAPLGPVGPGLVTATFFGFAPAMVARALPGVWELATPRQVLTARSSGARAALTRLGAHDDDYAEAAELARRAATAVDIAGKPLAAANAELVWPTDPLSMLWHACTVLREHRGDGHVAALTAAGLTGCQSLAWRAATDADREILQPARGWDDAQWDRARTGLIERGWLDDHGRPTTAGHAEFAEIERRTDELAFRPWRESGVTATERLAALLRPLARAAHAAMPGRTPIGALPRP
ncbi:SCO6745 family protein [Nocardia spumae]|uniref:SCO6745 family protein n=1 Tax=Nocardia spumae TaxID=2887190 RepID=UPI001D14F9CF|nr:hypothetical protein [Nocardia spumae]